MHVSNFPSDGLKGSLALGDRCVLNPVFGSSVEVPSEQWGHLAHRIEYAAM